MLSLARRVRAAAGAASLQGFVGRRPFKALWGDFAAVGTGDVAPVGACSGSAVRCFQLLPRPGGFAGVRLHCLELLCSGKFQLRWQAVPW